MVRKSVIQPSFAHARRRLSYSPSRQQRYRQDSLLRGQQICVLPESRGGVGERHMPGTESTQRER